MNVYKFDYPEFTLWNTGIAAADRLTVINSSDFPRQTMLQNLGLSKSPLADSFGICDLDELKERQNMLRFILASPAFAADVELDDSARYIPEEGQRYIEFNEFDEDHAHNPYWAYVREYGEILARYEHLPARLTTLREFIAASLKLESTEMELATALKGKILDMVDIEGMMRFEVFRESSYARNLKGLALRDCKAIGHKDCIDPKLAKPIECPEWVGNRRNPLNWVGVGKATKLMIGLRNRRRLSEANNAVITEAPEELIKDVRSGVWNMLHQIKLSDEEVRLLDGTQIEVAFCYGRNGLEIQVFNMYITRSIEFKKLDSTILDYCDAFQKKEKKRLRGLRKELCGRRNEALSGIAANRLIQRYWSEVEGFFGDAREIDAHNTDDKYRNCSVSQLAKNMGLMHAYEAITKHREYLRAHVKMLENVIGVANALKEVSDNTGQALTFPEFVEENVVSFKSIVPVNLIGRLKSRDIVRVRGLENLNGMTCLTGNHAGGKSQTLTSVAETIYQAQSGLPLLGTGIKLNVKQVLGLLAIERGEGSTVEIILKKLKAIFQSMEAVSGERIVLLLDEVGSATQEYYGLELGKDLLGKLSADKNISVIFSTQILELAKYAEANFGAHCFKLDAGHMITAGIGDGGMEELRKRIGLDEFLPSGKN